MKSGGFDTRSAAPSAPQPAGAERGFTVVALSAGFAVAFLAAVAVSVAQVAILLAH